MFDCLFRNSGDSWVRHAKLAAENLFYVPAWAVPGLLRCDRNCSKRLADDIPLHRFFYENKHTLFKREAARHV